MKPLRDSEHPLRQLLDAAAAVDERDDLAAGVRVKARLELGRRPRKTHWVLASAAVGVALVVALVWLRPAPLEADGRVDGLSWTWVGRDATAHRDSDTLTLGEGVLSLTAKRPTHLQTPDAEVSTTSARFRVLVAAGGATSVAVEEGTVVVRPRGQAVVSVQAGGQWSSKDMQPADATFHHWALELEAQGQARQALSVLEALTSHENVWGELALYDAARLCLELGEVARARSFLDRYEHRAPGGGVLRPEVKALREKLGR